MTKTTTPENQQPHLKTLLPFDNCWQPINPDTWLTFSTEVSKKYKHWQISLSEINTATFDFLPSTARDDCRHNFTGKFEALIFNTTAGCFEIVYKNGSMKRLWPIYDPLYAANLMGCLNHQAEIRIDTLGEYTAILRFQEK